MSHYKYINIKFKLNLSTEYKSFYPFKSLSYWANGNTFSPENKTLNTQISMNHRITEYLKLRRILKDKFQFLAPHWTTPNSNYMSESIVQMFLEQESLMLISFDSFLMNLCLLISCISINNFLLEQTIYPCYLFISVSFYKLSRRSLHILQKWNESKNNLLNNTGFPNLKK